MWNKIVVRRSISRISSTDISRTLACNSELARPFSASKALADNCGSLADSSIRSSPSLVFKNFSKNPVNVIIFWVSGSLIFDRSAKKRMVSFQDIIEYRSEEHTSELQSRGHLVCCLLLEKKIHTFSPSKWPVGYYKGHFEGWLITSRNRECFWVIRRTN